MRKTFIYTVNGEMFIDTVAFGKAWKQASALAELTHAEVRRTVVDGHRVSEQFFAKGVFLDMRHYTPEKAYCWR